VCLKPSIKVIKTKKNSLFVIIKFKIDFVFQNISELRIINRAETEHYEKKHISIVELIKQQDTR
jgi:hypothetical protein